MRQAWESSCAGACRILPRGAAAVSGVACGRVIPTQCDPGVLPGESASLELAANLAARIFRAMNVDVQLARLVSRVLLLGQLGIRGGRERVVAALGERNDYRAIAAGLTHVNVRSGRGHAGCGDGR